MTRWLSWLQTAKVQKVCVQGAATSVYAATASELDGQSGAYLTDCKVTKPSAAAQDAELASKLWDVTAQQLAEAQNLT